MANCAFCGSEMPDERLELYATCIECTDQSTYFGALTYDGKTAGHTQLIKNSPGNQEVVRQAQNFIRRKR